MDTPQQPQGEPERREGPGGRARRFGDTELSWVRDKDNRGAEETPTDHPGDPDPTSRGGVVEGVLDTGPAPETQRVDEPDQARDSKPVGSHVGAPGYAEQPATTGPVDSGYDPGVEEAGPGQFPSRSRDQSAADDSARGVGLLNDVAGLRDEWQRVQGTFVDDPQRAVREASMLVERTLDEIRVNVTSGHTSQTTSTEDLRVSFQRYREFFQRLLSA
jgi:hypothetical protein